MVTSLRARAVAAASCVLVALLVSAGLVGSRPSRALPVYSRRYGVPCQACHSIPPRLNRFGLAFQANHFNWPGGPPPAYHAGLAALPLSGLGTLSRLSPAPDGTAGSGFRTQELFLTDGFRLGGGGRGGYFVDYFAATRGAGIHPGGPRGCLRRRPRGRAARAVGADGGAVHAHSVPIRSDQQPDHHPSRRAEPARG